MHRLPICIIFHKKLPSIHGGKNEAESHAALNVLKKQVTNKNEEVED